MSPPTAFTQAHPAARASRAGRRRRRSANAASGGSSRRIREAPAPLGTPAAGRCRRGEPLSTRPARPRLLLGETFDIALSVGPPALHHDSTDVLDRLHHRGHVSQRRLRQRPTTGILQRISVEVRDHHVVPVRRNWPACRSPWIRWAGTGCVAQRLQQSATSERRATPIRRVMLLASRRSAMA